MLSANSSATKTERLSHLSLPCNKTAKDIVGGPVIPKSDERVSTHGDYRRRFGKRSPGFSIQSQHGNLRVADVSGSANVGKCERATAAEDALNHVELIDPLEGINRIGIVRRTWQPWCVISDWRDTLRREAQSCRIYRPDRITDGRRRSHRAVTDGSAQLEKGPPSWILRPVSHGHRRKQIYTLPHPSIQDVFDNGT